MLEFNQQFALLSLQLHNQSEPDEKLMGWYHTKPYLDEDSQAFHDLFLKNPDFQVWFLRYFYFHFLFSFCVFFFLSI